MEKFGGPSGVSPTGKNAVAKGIEPPSVHSVKAWGLNFVEDSCSYAGLTINLP